MATTNFNTLSTQHSRRAVLTKISELEHMLSQSYEDLAGLRLQCESRWAFRPGQIRSLDTVLNDVAEAIRLLRVVILRGSQAVQR